MKKIQLLLLMLTVLVLTGCSVDYNLKFNNDTIDEEIVTVFDGNIYKLAEEFTGDGLYPEEEAVYNDISSLKNGKDNYKKTIILGNNTSTVTLKYTYTYDNLEESYLADQCFENALFLNEKDSYYIKLSGVFTCASNNTINFKITTDKEVMNHNAEKVEGNTYIWTLGDEGNNNEVLFQMSKVKESSINDSSTKVSTVSVLRIITLLVLIGAGVAVFLIRKKMNNDLD